MKKTTQAFTLMEVILAMGVCAIVMIAISGIFFSAVHVRERTIAAVDEGLPVQQAVAFLRRDLQGAMSPSTNGVMSGDFRVGSAPETAIELYTTTGALLVSAPWGDVQKITYGVKDKQLVRGVTRNVLAAVAPTPDDQMLVDGVDSVQFDCYDGTQWRSTWDTTLADTNLPIAVRVRIQMAGASPNRQPIELIVPVNAQSSTNQVQNPEAS
jgi:type II secretion system protein J